MNFKLAGKTTISVFRKSTGTIFIIVLPIVSFVLCATLIGIPFGVFGFVVWFATFILAWMLAPILLGSLIRAWWLKNKDYGVSWKSIVLGSVVYSLLSFIPILGCLLQIAIMFTALGSALKLKWRVAREWR